MKKLWIIAAVLCLSALCFGCTTVRAQGVSVANDASWDTVEASSRLKIGIDRNFAPVSFYNGNGQPAGFDADVAAELCRRLGVSAEFVPVSACDSLESLEKKNVDCIWSVCSDNKAARTVSNRSFGYLSSQQVVLCLSDSGAKKLVDLKGQRIGVRENSMGEEALAASTAFRDSLKSVGTYRDYAEAKDSLDSKKISAIVVDSFVAQYYQQQQPGVYTVIMTDAGDKPEILKTEDYCVEFRPADNSLALKVEKALDEMSADGTLSTFSKKWFGKDLSAVTGS